MIRKCLKLWCPGPESNRYGRYRPRDFKSLASTYSATQAKCLAVARIFGVEWMLSYFSL